MMLLSERQQQIVRLIKKYYVIRVRFLSKKLRIPETIVRRELKKLIDAGIVTRSYGGVKLNPQTNGSARVSSDKRSTNSSSDNSWMMFHLGAVTSSDFSSDDC